MQTYNDVFVEQLVKRENGGRRTLMKAGAVLFAILLILAVYLTPYLSLFFPFFFAVICILLFFSFKYTVLEYEYAFTNGEVDIDRITGKRRRKRLYNTSCGAIQVMAPCTQENLDAYAGIKKRLDTASSAKSGGRWFFVSGAGGEEQALVIFEPNDRMREAFGKYLGRRMKAE